MPEQPSFADLTIQEVLEMVENGEYTPEEALEIEQKGKNRTRLIDALHKLTAPETDDTKEPESPKEETETGNVTVTLLKNIKYKGERYKIGQEIEIDESDKESFIKSGIIKGD